MVDRDPRDELETAAAGLALGLLEGSERAEALRRQLSDTDFAERVRAWQQVADRWLEGVEPVSAPANALDLIEVALDRRTNGESGSPVAGNAGSLAFWRGWALTATAASLVFAVGLGLVLSKGPAGGDRTVEVMASAGPAPQSANVAQIDDAEGLPLVSALYDPSSGELSLRLADLQEPGLSPELWLIPQDGVPRSLGMLQQDRVTISISPELRDYLRDGAAMAITMEPDDGKFHNAPTGEILGTAILQEVLTGQT